MSVINQLASSLQRRDEAPNMELAANIAAAKNKAAVKELITHLAGKNKDIRNDCIKVLYETGHIAPELIAPYLQDFVALLSHKDNRLQWGAMTALDAITAEAPGAIYDVLPEILAAADSGSVITKDHAVNILIRLAGIKDCAADIFPLLNEQLLSSPVNQLPMYAENALPVIDDSNRAVFVATLTARLADIEKESKRKRVEKVIKKAGK